MKKDGIAPTPIAASDILRGKMLGTVRFLGVEYYAEQEGGVTYYYPDQFGERKEAPKHLVKTFKQEGRA